MGRREGTGQIARAEGVMDRRLDSLDPRFKPFAIELIARLIEAAIPVVIINTRRTQAEQDAAKASGHSWVTRSRHQDGLAIDLVPYDAFQAHGPDKLLWNAADPVWATMGEVGEKLGLTWGGRWVVRDMGHFELRLGG